MAVFFWYLVKIDLSSVRYCIYTCTLDKSRFTRHQKNTAMFTLLESGFDEHRLDKTFGVPVGRKEHL